MAAMWLYLGRETFHPPQHTNTHAHLLSLTVVQNATHRPFCCHGDGHVATTIGFSLQKLTEFAFQGSGTTESSHDVASGGSVRGFSFWFNVFIFNKAVCC